jgi:hypothetical protein
MVVSDMWHIPFSAENLRRVNTAMICRPSGHHLLSRVSDRTRRVVLIGVVFDPETGQIKGRLIEDSVAMVLIFSNTIGIQCISCGTDQALDLRDPP